jgi:hypothetical protein
MHVFGDLPVNEDLALRAHLEGCVDCQALVREMTETFETLQYVDPSAIASSTSVSAELSQKVLGDLRRAGVRQRRTQRIRVVSVACVGAVAVSLIFVGLFTGKSVAPPLHRTVALRGSASVKAIVELTSMSWGTAVDLKERGLPSGTLYTVSMESKNGTWWTAGTYRSVPGKTVNATMTCAVALKSITDVRVVNGAGVTVLSNYKESATGADE